MNAYQAYSQLLFARADSRGVPLSGTFELTPRCNFRCSMCYIHRAEQDAAALAQEKTAPQWLALAEECCRAGTLLLLLTGGEPLLRPDFREIYTGCRRMGLMVSLNTNGSLLDEDMVQFLAADPPARVNITLYGASAGTYGALCGRPDAFERVIGAILRLQQAGILVKLNLSLTPDNRHDAQKIYDFAREHRLPLQAAVYMFPPVRVCVQPQCGARLTPEQAAEEKVRYDRARLGGGALRRHWEDLLAGRPAPAAECQELPLEKIRCRAGSSTFWVTWDHQLRPCGMMTEPGVDLAETDFARAWQRLRQLRGQIVVPARCTACPVRNACDQCAAVCHAEGGSYAAVPDYMCRMTEEYLRRIGQALEQQP